MTLPDSLSVIARPFPSSVLAVIRGPRPIVMDPGSLTDADQLPGLLENAGVAWGEVGLVLCSHYHSDHVGAVATLQEAGVEVAAHAWDAAMINAPVCIASGHGPVIDDAATAIARTRKRLPAGRPIRPPVRSTPPNASSPTGSSSSRSPPN